ncbi:EndoU domain-containing protein [Yeosuana marina]|uniref:EndoU domain-containing protein n=1 Tax=Yeosuana marina TaxID=1565536 RepID=UPI001423A6C8|nr:EndoU domain-containing protein [Yeosuana marina]
MKENYSYYIIDNVWKATGQEVNTDTRIIKVPDYYPIREGEGPYKSIRNLRRSSMIFKKVVLKGSKHVQKVLNNISTIEKYILTPAGKTYKEDFINVYLHATTGKVKNRKVTGLHYYDPNKIRIIEEEDYDKNTGVFKAKIEFYDKNTNRWIPKKTSSTFFPKTWIPTTLFNECDFANSNKVKNEETDYVYFSKTLSGIPVKIIIIEGKLISIYPIIQGNHVSSQKINQPT